jgi:spore coat protein A, manganese oxidase
VKDLGHEPSKPHYKRWKDTGSVDAKTVSVFRIRWAKSAYDKNKVGGDTYFHVPLDQLREYPGFVYHCHILGHEDSEMMRPIMLQLPSDTKLNN